MDGERTTGDQPPNFSILWLAITEHAPLAMAMVAGAMRVVRHANPAFCRLMDQPMEQLVGKPLHELLPERDECLTLLDRVFRTGQPASHTEEEDSKPDPVYWSYSMWPVLADEQGAGVMIQVTETAQFHARTLAMNQALILGAVRQHELTEAAERARETIEKSREELWAALQETDRARAEAEAAGRAKDDFLATLSHELRTPLTPVLIAVQTMVRRDGLAPGLREALEMIGRNVQLQAHFIDDLLDVTRIARGKLELVREPLDLHDAVRRAVEVSQPDIGAKNQQLTVELNAQHSELTGDRNRLQQVFWNLIKNASKFTPEGGSIWVTSRSGEGRVFVEVSDTGRGLEAAETTRIFDAFRQASEAVTREFGGLGLGLAICKATVDGHRGTLRAKSAGRLQGATFTVELPLTDVA